VFIKTIFLHLQVTTHSEGWFNFSKFNISLCWRIFFYAISWLYFRIAILSFLYNVK